MACIAVATEARSQEHSVECQNRVEGGPTPLVRSCITTWVSPRLIPFRWAGRRRNQVPPAMATRLFDFYVPKTLLSCDEHLGVRVRNASV